MITKASKNLYNYIAKKWKATEMNNINRIRKSTKVFKIIFQNIKANATAHNNNWVCDLFAHNYINLQCLVEPQWSLLDILFNGGTLSKVIGSESV